VSQHRRFWHRSLFRPKHAADLSSGELIWRPADAFPDTASGPYRVERVEPACPGQVYVRIVSMESSGLFGIAWGPVLVPRYR
jgi:hypothetical protein